LRGHTSPLVILALSLAWGSGAAQNSTPVEVAQTSGATVRLESHNGQTHFKIGDPVVLDLVFTGRSPGYVVNTNTTSYLPVSDLVELAPESGWVRSHSSFRGQGLNGNALANLDSSSIRVPILLNRTITFKEPGHYEVTVTTERLRTSDDWTVTSLESCGPCRTTNAVGIDLSERDESEEAALVESLSRELEETKNSASAGELSHEQKEEFLSEIEALRSADDSTEAGREQAESLQRKLTALTANKLAAIQKQEAARREAAVRLAYLVGDDAVRAKVHFMADVREVGEANPIGPIIRDGLASSRNKQLQLALLEAAWRDPQRVPTSERQAALRQAKELMHEQMVTDDARSGPERPRSDKRSLRSIRLRSTRSLPLYTCARSQTGRKPSTF